MGAKMARKRDVSSASTLRRSALYWQRVLSMEYCCWTPVCVIQRFYAKCLVQPMFVQAYNVQVFDGRFVEERVLRDAGLLDTTRTRDST